jgi:hypothetical protein
MENTWERIAILRETGKTRCLFKECFKGFETVNAVKRIFGSRTTKTLKELTVEFTKATIYMRVNNSDGHLVINPRYFTDADTTDLYLDVIHELVHVKQFTECRISDQSIEYTKRPLEVEAYKVTVDEARTLGLGKNWILNYLDSDLVKNEQLEQLAAAVGID